MSKFNFVNELQLVILHEMFNNFKFASKCSMYIQPEYFSNKYLSWFFNIVKDKVDRYKEKPSLAYVKNKLKALDSDDISSYKKVTTNILKKEPTDLIYIKDELTSFIRTSEFKKMHKKSADLYMEGKTQEAYNYVQDQITRIQRISFKDDDYIKKEDIDDIVDSEINSTSERIPTGITLIDDSLFGGLPKGSVSTIIGGYNVGKSIASINIAYWAAKLAKRRVLYIFHEGRKSQVVFRFLSRISGIQFNTLMSGRFREDPKMVEKYEEAKDFIGEYIRIKEMREVGMTVEQVYRYCKMTKEEWNYDLMIDDYGQKLFSSEVRYREHRLNQAHIWNVFDHMSAELDIAILTLAQLNREHVIHNREGTRIIRSTGISECAAINHVSETILTLNKSAQDEETNMLTVCLDKCRDGRVGKLIDCETDMSRMRMFHPRMMSDGGWDTGRAIQRDNVDE